jgi:hypothetical protein
MTQRRAVGGSWPDLPYPAWRETCTTLPNRTPSETDHCRMVAMPTLVVSAGVFPAVREGRDSHRSLERDVPFQREIDTLAKSRKSLYPFRKLTIFNGLLNFETRLVGDSD